MSEASFMQAISDHMTDVTGEPHVVTQYVVIADVLNEDGEESMLWTSSNSKWIADFKMVGYVFEQVKHRMKQQWDVIFKDNDSD